MIQEDYVMRWIRQLSQALTQIIFRKENQQYDDALDDIRQTGELFLGLNLNATHVLTREVLYDALQIRSAKDAPDAALVADLLIQQGECFAALDRAGHARASRRLALHLYLDLVVSAPDTAPSTHVETLLGTLDPSALPLETRLLLFRYLDAAGRYAEAENLLFHLAEEHPDAVLFQEGTAFFKRLLRTSYRHLQAGNLPYEEVKEGLAAWQRTMDTAHLP